MEFLIQPLEAGAGIFELNEIKNDKCTVNDVEQCGCIHNHVEQCGCAQS